MRVKFFIICLMAIVLIFLPMCTLGQPNQGAPTVTPRDVKVNPGDVFELKVSVTANMNGTYRVTFNERDRFSFPAEKFAEHNLTKGDAILFEVKCKVEDKTPDGDFNVTYKVTWEYNGTPQEHTDAIRVTVGEGADSSSDPCGTSSVIAAVSILAGSVVLIRRRKRRS